MQSRTLSIFISLNGIRAASATARSENTLVFGLNDTLVFGLKVGRSTLSKNSKVKISQIKRRQEKIHQFPHKFNILESTFCSMRAMAEAATTPVKGRCIRSLSVSA